MNRRSTCLVLATALCSLAVPGIASAATKTVIAGPPVKKAPAGVPKDGDLNQFFPSAVKIHAGDSVKWAVAGFHIVNFPKQGDPAPPLAAPDPALPVANVLDAAGQPFWFNGQGTPVVPPIVALGSGSGKAYTGAAPLGSGVPAGPGAPKPFVVKFPKAGTYTYYCVLHNGMKGTVSVLPKSKPVPSAKADAARVKAQLAKGFAALKQLGKAKTPADTIVAGPDKAGGSVLLRFSPDALTTKVGTPISLQMSTKSSEVHTFTFAKDVKAAGKKAEAEFFGPIAGTGTGGPPAIGFSPKWAYPSDAPGAPLSYDGTNHGDGFLNTGVLDGSAATPFPQKVSVSFGKAGTYTFFCAIHPFMTGKVTVTQ